MIELVRAIPGAIRTYLHVTANNVRADVMDSTGGFAEVQYFLLAWADFLDALAFDA